MTHEEQAIAELPEEYRQKMARYTLGGWMFRLWRSRAVNFWWVTKPNRMGLFTGTTLLDLLTNLPDAASE